MASGSGNRAVARQSHRLFGEGTVSGMDEADLLRRFASRRDPVALEALVNRHGPMVLGVCRRVLGNLHASEDAFQATFLILARRAGSIRDPDRLGPWLYGVAHRVAVRSRANAVRRNNRERTGIEAEAEDPSSAEPDLERSELRATVDEEVRRLPEKFRVPVILCYFDGLTHDEAADRLRCPVGTVRSRLATGRDRLRDRLARRGLAVSSVFLATTLEAEAAPVAVPPILIELTWRMASGAGVTSAGMVSAGVASLAEGTMKTMILSKLKIVAGVALASVLTLGVGTVAAQKLGDGGKVGAGAASEDTLDQLITRLKERAEQSEQRTQALEAELKALREEKATAETENTTKKVLGPSDPFVEEGGSIRKKGTDQRTLNKAKSEARAGMAKGMAGMATAGGGMPGMMGMGGMGGMPSMGSMMASMGGMGMAGMGGMGRGVMGMNRPIDPGKAIASIQADDFVVVHKPQTDKVAAYSTETGQWSTYQVPQGTDVVPIASVGVVALHAEGDEISQIATFLPNAGQWFPMTLKAPAHGAATPNVGPALAVYAIGRHVYAFSAPAKTWGVLELAEGANPTPVVFNNRATVEHGDHLYIFSVKTGQWTDYDAKTGKASPATRE